MQSRNLRSFFNVSNRNGSSTTRLRDEDPDQTAVIKVGQSINQKVGKVIFFSIICTPPHDGTVNDISVVLVDELFARLGFNGDANLLVSVIVDVKLLNNLSQCETEAHRHDEQPPFGVSARSAEVCNTLLSYCTSLLKLHLSTP